MVHVEEDVTQQAKVHFDAIGRRYHAITDTPSFRHYLERRKAYLRAFFAAGSSETLTVDLAAGTGQYSDVIAQQGRLINMDLSFNSLQAGRLVHPGIARVTAEAAHIPLRDAVADRLLLIGLLHHVPDRLPDVFRECARVLKPGGVVCIDEANGYNLFWFIEMKLCEIDRVGTRPLFPCQLRRIARHSGFAVEQELFWGFMPPWSAPAAVTGWLQRLERSLERSWLSRVCTRYVLVLRK